MFVITWKTPKNAHCSIWWLICRNHPPMSISHSKRKFSTLAAGSNWEDDWDTSLKNYAETLIQAEEKSITFSKGDTLYDAIAIFDRTLRERWCLLSVFVMSISLRCYTIFTNVSLIIAAVKGHFIEFIVSKFMIVASDSFYSMHRRPKLQLWDNHLEN